MVATSIAGGAPIAGTMPPGPTVSLADLEEDQDERDEVSDDEDTARQIEGVERLLTLDHGVPQHMLHAFQL